MSIETATGPWETGEPPRDGIEVLGHFPDGCISVVSWQIIWESEDSNETEMGWCISGTIDFFADYPIRWAKINLP